MTVLFKIFSIFNFFQFLPQIISQNQEKEAQKERVAVCVEGPPERTNAEVLASIKKAIIEPFNADVFLVAPYKVLENETVEEAKEKVASIWDFLSLPGKSGSLTEDPDPPKQVANQRLFHPDLLPESEHDYWRNFRGSMLYQGIGSQTKIEILKWITKVSNGKKKSQISNFLIFLGFRV